MASQATGAALQQAGSHTDAQITAKFQQLNPTQEVDTGRLWRHNGIAAPGSSADEVPAAREAGDACVSTKHDEAGDLPSGKTDVEASERSTRGAVRRRMA